MNCCFTVWCFFKEFRVVESCRTGTGNQPAGESNWELRHAAQAQVRNDFYDPSGQLAGRAVLAWQPLSIASYVRLHDAGS